MNLSPRLPLCLMASLVLLGASTAAQSIQTAPAAGGTPPGATGSLRYPTTVVKAQLAGRYHSTAPWFEYVRAFNVGELVRMTVDPVRYPSVVGVTADVYVVAARTRGEWMHDQSLVDVAWGPVSFTFSGASVQSNVILLDTGTLSGDAGASIGVGYDIVIDLDGSGTLSDNDIIDGFGVEAGFYVVHDLTQPGPLAVTTMTYSGGTWLGQQTFYPTDIANMGKLPLVVISHGNGHNYLWYGHLGEHLASYGYIVMSHQNNTGPGIQTASVTTLKNTDYIIVNQDTIGGGVLDGHLDSHRITWIGHSRGGEGITRAYDAIHDGETSFNTSYTLEDIKLLSSIAPTDFLGPTKADPHAVTYSLWTGGADSDVDGCAGCNICQTFHLFDRAEQDRYSISLHGVGHGDFHDGGGSSWASGPCKVGRAKTHQIMLGYVLPLLEHRIRGNIPAKDYLWRQYETFHPIGAPVSDSCVVVDLMYQAGDHPGKFVLDDFQTNAATTLSSSGGAVSFTVTSLVEGRLDDNDSGFLDEPANDPMNGMTHAGPNDTGSGIVFEYDAADSFIAFDVPAGAEDFSGYDFLSFRAVQATRNPHTTSVLEDTTFVVTLHDGTGGTSSINIGTYGGGIEEPYQRTTCGTGAGWANEWETVRIRLLDFLHDQVLDLSNITSVVFEFGPSFGSIRGRLGLDEIEVTND